jgi:hypothetical protein
MPRFMTFGGPTLATLLTLATLTGCGDKNIAKLTVGIPRDSVIKILGQGSSATDSTPNVYREERYLNEGHFITMLMYSNTGKKEGIETIPEEELLPVVLVDDTLTGWGWEHHDSVANVNRIVIKPRAK